MRSSLIRSVAALVAIGSLAACSGGGSSGVGVKNLESDVVFGAAAPASLDPDGVTDDEATQFDELPPQLFEPVRRAPRPTYAMKPAEACPAAALEEFPDRSAPLWGPEDTKAPPAEGLYRWQRNGTLNSADSAGATVTVKGFERRLIRNVEVVSTAETPEGGNEITFTYEQVQPVIDNTGIIVTTFQIKSVGSPKTQAAYNPTRGQDELTVGEPERGMVIKRIEVQDRDGVVVSTFAPVSGLLLLPYRVRQGESWSSVALDPKTGERLQLDGKVGDRGRVDACGDIIEGWNVSSTLTSTIDGVVATRTYDYLIAPQYGSLLLSEKITQGDPAGAGDAQDITYSIGQQDPDPLPAGDAEEGS